jgi:hypothetical protein
MAVNVEKRTLQTLRFIARQRRPVFGGPLSRGVKWHDYDDPIPHLVEQDLIEQVGVEGFRLTKRGSYYVQESDLNNILEAK